MKFNDIKKLKRTELDKKTNELKIELIKLQAQSATGTAPKSPGQINQIKKTMARIKTLKRQNELNEMMKQAQQPKATEPKTEMKKSKEDN